MENAIEAECDVALYGYSCLQTPPHDLLTNSEKNMLLDITSTRQDYHGKCN
jgi:hypothetical protein